MTPVTGLAVAPEALLAFLALAVVVLATPGPSLLLIAATSLARGRRAGLLAVLGTEAGLAVVLAAIAAGLGAILDRVAGGLEVVRWAGIAWLVGAGVRALTSAGRRPVDAASGAGFWLAFGVSALNPATTPFLLALLPQFVAPGRPAGPQLATFGVAFLVLATAIDLAVALLAAQLRAVAAAGPSPLGRRLTGLLLLGAGLLLALARTGTAG